MNRSSKPSGTCHKCDLKLPHPKVRDDIVSPDSDAQNGFTLSRLTDMVDVNYLATVQQKHAASRPRTYKRSNGLFWRNAAGEAWVPDDAKELQHQLYAVAHQGISGHRGRDVTMQHLKGRVHLY